MTVDMNRFENKTLRAYNTKRNIWRFACLSGLPGSRAPDVYRVDVDTSAGESLEDYQLWVVEPRDSGSFLPLHRVYRTTAIYS